MKASLGPVLQVCGLLLSMVNEPQGAKTGYGIMRIAPRHLPNPPDFCLSSRIHNSPFTIYYSQFPPPMRISPSNCHHRGLNHGQTRTPQDSRTRGRRLEQMEGEKAGDNLTAQAGGSPRGGPSGGGHRRCYFGTRTGTPMVDRQPIKAGSWEKAESMAPWSKALGKFICPTRLRGTRILSSIAIQVSMSGTIGVK
jgi:hypothetical protein